LMFAHRRTYPLLVGRDIEVDCRCRLGVRSFSSSLPPDPGCQGRSGHGHRPTAAAHLGTPEGEKRSMAETEADEVGASLKFATAKVERASDRRRSRQLP
jgi:hypothetical protein